MIYDFRVQVGCHLAAALVCFLSGVQKRLLLPCQCVLSLFIRTLTHRFVVSNGASIVTNGSVGKWHGHFRASVKKLRERADLSWKCLFPAGKLLPATIRFFTYLGTWPASVSSFWHVLWICVYWMDKWILKNVLKNFGDVDKLICSKGLFYISRLSWIQQKSVDAR